MHLSALPLARVGTVTYKYITKTKDWCIYPFDCLPSAGKGKSHCHRNSLLPTGDIFDRSKIVILSWRRVFEAA